MRYTIHQGDYTYAYGHDFAVGLFFEKYKDLPNNTLFLFDISEFINFMPHPEFKALSTSGEFGHILSRDEIISTMKWEMDNEGFVMPENHWEAIKQGKNDF